MRIGTWNLEGKWSADHASLIAREKCDVWLLTELRREVLVPGMHLHRTAGLMDSSKSWAGILSTDEVVREPDPHPATAMARIRGLRYMSSVLPWRSCGPSWEGGTLADKLRATLRLLGPFMDPETVWGGDWNQALEGPEYVGSFDGRKQVHELTQASKLSVPTSVLASSSKGHRAIDHIAVPLDWDIDAAYRVVARAGARRLSDHDAYVVSVED